MENLHIRLRDELDRLGISMAEAARAIGEDNSQGLRDVCSGRKRAGAELVGKLSVTGIDVLYVLTGNKVVDVQYHLTPEEAVLLKNYRAISPSRKACLTDVASALSDKDGGEIKALG